MYEKMDDGVILCKMINLAAPDTIDERVLNKGKNVSIFKVLNTTEVSQLHTGMRRNKVQTHENYLLIIFHKDINKICCIYNISVPRPVNIRPKIPL